MSAIITAYTFRPEAFKLLNWVCVRYVIKNKRKPDIPARKVTVFAPSRSIADMGVGHQKDESIQGTEISGPDALLAGGFKHSNKADIVSFFDILARNTMAGISTTDALRRCAANARSPYMRGVVGTVHYQIAHFGMSLSSSMRLFPDCFPESVLAQVEGGENTGKLPECLASLAKATNEDLKLITKLRGLLVYPALLSLAVVGLMCLIYFFIIPRMMPLFESMGKDKLPTSTKIVVGLGMFLKQYPYIPILALAGLAWWASYWRRILGNRHIQLLMMKTPVLGRVLTLIVAIRTLRTFAQLQRSGVSVDKSFEIVLRVSQNVVFEEYFTGVQQRLGEGMPMDQAFFTERHRLGDLGLDIGQQVELGVITGDIFPGLMRLVETLQLELNVVLETLPTFLNVVMMLKIAPMLILAALSVIEPSLAMAGGGGQ